MHLLRVLDELLAQEVGPLQLHCEPVEPGRHAPGGVSEVTPEERGALVDQGVDLASRVSILGGVDETNSLVSPSGHF